MTLPKLNIIITIDVEEDSWGFEHREFPVENIRRIPFLQNMFDRYTLQPTYLISYQVASHDWAVGILSDIFSKNRCEIGAHLHPWNTPPFKENINERNSMLKNLPYELQAEKINVLSKKIESVFGKKPRSFRAGRWGLGNDTIKALIACGYFVDSSVTPTISWAACGDGPEYPDAENVPYWMTADGERSRQNGRGTILEVPATIGFNRWPFELWQKIYLQFQRDWLKPFRPTGIMHRTRLLRKIWLSPEMSSANDMITLSRIMIRNGIQFLNLSFHSATLVPGRTPFVKNNIDLENFYLRLEKLFDYLKNATKLNAVGLSDVNKLLEKGSE